jgi:hypothetical protein
MTLFSAYSPVKSGGSRRRAAAAAMCAGALALIAGCSAGSTSSTGPGGSTPPSQPAQPTGSAVQETPQKAISLAAEESRRVNTMAANFSEQVGNPVIATTSATAQLQLRPVLLANESLHTSANGQKVAVDEIVTAKAVYIKESTSQSSKPWVEVPFSELGGSLGSSISALLQDAQNANPAQQTEVLTASKNVHVVGTQVVNGVETTHYSGTVSASTALSKLPANVRKGLAPLLKLITGDIRFDVWIDAQHVTRKLIERETVEGEPATVTLNVTAVNQPVQIAPPPASEVTLLPASQLGSL